MIYCRDWNNYDDVGEILGLSFNEVNELIRKHVLSIVVSDKTGLISIDMDSVREYLRSNKKLQG